MTSLSVSPRTVARFWKNYHARQKKECWEWQGYVDPHGYGRFHARALGERSAHRVAYIIAHGPIPAGLVVRHTCDNRRCVNPAHLVLGTSADNTADRTARHRSAFGRRNGKYTHPECTPRGDRHGARVHPETRPQGEAHGRAKLTNAQAVDIRIRYAKGGLSQTALAKEFGVNQTAISALVRGAHWKHIS